MNSIRSKYETLLEIAIKNNSLKIAECLINNEDFMKFYCTEKTKLNQKIFFELLYDDFNSLPQSKRILFIIFYNKTFIIIN